MVFNIEEFKARTSAGFLRTSYFYTTITPPNFWTGRDTRFLSFLCSGVQFPGAHIVAPEQQRWGYGPLRKMPAGMVHPDITMTVYSDGNGDAADFFTQWTQNIVSFGDTQRGINGVPFGLVHYPDDYMTTIDLYYMSETGDENCIFQCTFTEAFPVGMGSVDLNWNSGAQIAQFVVPFNYRTFQIVKNIISADGVIYRDTQYIDQTYSPYQNSSAMSINSGIIGINNIAQSLSQALSIIGSPAASTVQRIAMMGNVIQGDIYNLSGATRNIINAFGD